MGIYVHVDDRAGLEAADFSVLEAGVAQSISAVDLSEDLPVVSGLHAHA